MEQPISVPPQTPISDNQPIPPAKPGRSNIWILGTIFLGILTIFLVTPIPYYQTEEIICKPGQTNCPKPGWHTNPSILQSILASRSTRSGLVSVIQPTPSPLPDPTANWKTYINSKYNYSVKYPNNWTAKSTEPGPPDLQLNSTARGLVLYPSKFESSAQAQNSVSLMIEGPENVVYPTYEKWVNDVGKNVYFKVTNTEEKQFAEKSAKVVSGEYDGYGFPAKIISIYFGSTDGKSYYNVSVVDNKNDSDLSTINQILSTFTFLDTADMGTLKATVIRSPTCPGPQKPDKTCEAPYANGTFRVISETKSVAVKTVTTDANGTFTASLPAGIYTIENAEIGIGKTIRNPAVTITAGQTTTQRFEVDTGIR